MLIASQLTGHPEPPPHKWIYMNAVEDGEDVEAQHGQTRNDGRGTPLPLHASPVQEEDEDVIIVSEILQVEKDEAEDTSAIGYTEDAMRLQWMPPVGLLLPS
jgi:hypothetical protein